MLPKYLREMYDIKIDHNWEWKQMSDEHGYGCEALHAPKYTKDG